MTRSGGSQPPAGCAFLGPAPAAHPIQAEIPEGFGPALCGRAGNEDMKQEKTILRCLFV